MCGSEIGNDGDGTKRHDGDLDAARRQLVLVEFVPKCLEAEVQFVDRATTHRP